MSLLSDATIFMAAAISQFRALPFPDQDCTGRVIIVTGANTGLGLEAARHFVRLNASKVIVACRDADKGAAAARDIELSTHRLDVVDVWPLDLCSFDSVKQFAARAAELKRLDVLVNNASTLSLTAEYCQQHETMVRVNVLATMLLTLLLLPTLRQTAAIFNVSAHIVTVSSVGAFMAQFPQRNSPNILEQLKKPNRMEERYNVTKLMQLIMARKLATSIDASDKTHVIVNAVHPGLCRTGLFKSFFFPLNLITALLLLLVGRSCEVGSRTLVNAASAGEDTNGQFMSDCKPSSWPSLMEGAKGKVMMDRVWDELLLAMEEVEPGVTKNI